MIIVTGGAGFIGSNVVAALEDEKYDVVAIDWLGNGEKWRNVAKRNSVRIVSPEFMFDYICQNGSAIEAVIHLGAISSTVERDVDLIYQTNVELSGKIWAFCRDNSKRLIYASSAAVYGDGSNGFVDDDRLSEMKKLRPLNAYGWSKLMYDKFVAGEIESGRGAPKQYVGLRFFNVYGPNEYHKGGQRSMVVQAFEQAKDRHYVELFRSTANGLEDGGHSRDFVYVGDCVRVILWLLKHPDVNGVLNVGTGHSRTFNELVGSTLIPIPGMPLKICYKDMPASLRRQYQNYTCADIRKLRKVGYMEEMTPLEEGVREYVCGYLNTGDWYR